MKTKRTNLERIRYLSAAGMIAAIYTVLTCIVGAFNLAGGAIQLRISEAMCILPAFLPAAIPGLTLGCLLSNFLLGALWQDILFGTLATLIGAVGARMLRRTSPYLIPIPTVVSNTLIIPPLLSWVYHAEQALPWLFLSIGIGELLSAWVLGVALYIGLSKRSGIFEKK